MMVGSTKILRRRQLNSVIRIQLRTKVLLCDFDKVTVMLTYLFSVLNRFVKLFQKGYNFLPLCFFFFFFRKCQKKKSLTENSKFREIRCFLNHLMESTKDISTLYIYGISMVSAVMQRDSEFFSYTNADLKHRNSC